MTTDNNNKSVFVTVTAWIFICLTGFMTLISILQNIMFGMMLSIDEMQEAIQKSTQSGQMPAYAEFIFQNMQLFLVLILVISLVFLLSSVGLLRRKEFARKMFIGILLIAIIWNIGGLILNVIIMPAMVADMPANTPQSFNDTFTLMMNVTIVISFLVSIAISVLFGWIIYKLTTPVIKSEFL